MVDDLKSSETTEQSIDPKTDSPKDVSDTPRKSEEFSIRLSGLSNIFSKIKSSTKKQKEPQPTTMEGEIDFKKLY